MNKRLFTLIELLVTVAIIGMLASLLLPALSTAKSLSRQISCQNKMRQIYLVTNMYSNDFNDYWIPLHENQAADDAAHGWGWTLYRFDYLKNTSVLLCPDVPNSWEYSRDFITNPASSLSFLWVSYGYNAHGLGSSYFKYGTRFSPPTQRSKITNPSRIAAFADSIYVYSAIPRGIYYFILNPDNLEAQVHSRHNKSANIIFSDGHASSMKNARYKIEAATVEGGVWGYRYMNPYIN